MLGFKKAWLIFEKKQKKYAIFIFFLMFLSMILEALSIGILVPLLSILLEGNIDSGMFSYFFTFGKVTDNNLIYIGLIIAVSIFIFKNLFLIFNNWHLLKFLESIYVELSDKLFRNYLRRDYIFFLQTNTARLVRNINEEVDSLVNYSNQAMVIISEIVIFLGILTVLFYVDFFGTSIILLLVSVFAITIYLFTKKRINILGKEIIAV